jgi:hypothetical protein
MPYVICSDCELLTYSIELWASTEQCPRCGAAQPTERRAAVLAVTGDDRVSGVPLAAYAKTDAEAGDRRG